MSRWRHARAITLLPGNVTIVVPTLILILGSGPDVGWGSGGLAAAVLTVLGAGLIAAGLSMFVWTVGLFAREGQGTLAAWDATRQLVVAGPYRHVRNPMISAVLAVLLGEAVLFGSPALLVWAGVFVAINHTYFLLFEERGLEHRFGADYRRYRQNVPRWIPRRSPWAPPAPGADDHARASGDVLASGR